MRIDQIDHVSLFVSDLDRSLVFYTEVLGFGLAYRGSLGTGLHGAFVDIGTTMINLLEGPDLGPLIAEQHIGFAVDDLDALQSALQERGVVFDQPAPEILPEGYVTGQRFLDLRDPDGIRLELVERDALYKAEHAARTAPSWADG